ncbi:hypothetical protein [Cytobacillus sp. NCCP-133]|uniref:hypothetical protein n=1 Tax=Cytobacillus sp. NCCP-133 TaxID=766848 RepID=UPI00222E79DC|nr:hypothetical protein [Cytobacillus sp. NCCP-133]GLB60824.1 hypothetical protein NCCP133_29560 [Cytobacillus sp. NCCP-133]
MALPAAIVITLYQIYFFYLLKKRLSFLQNSIVFMFIFILLTYFSTIINLQLKWLDVTEDSLLFMFYLLNRDIIKPLFVLVFINVFAGGKTFGKKGIIFIAMVLSMLLLDILSQIFGVVTYIKWNLFYAALANGAFLMLGLGLAKGVKYLKRVSS